MKKILNEWKIFLKENSEFSEDKLLNKVGDIFFGAYNVWEPEYKKSQNKQFLSYYDQLKSNANKKFKDTDKIEKVIGGAGIGISLYWTDHPMHGAGSEETAAFVITRKLQILEDSLSPKEKEALKSGLMAAVVNSVREDRSNQMYPTTLAVSVGVINGKQVIDAYMTTLQGMRKFVIPILSKAGYYDTSAQQEPQLPTGKTKRKKHDPKMSLADMKAMMDKFGR